MMQYIGEGIHAVEYGKRRYFARFNPSALGDDGTGTFQAWLSDSGVDASLTGLNKRNVPASTRHVSVPSVSPDGKHVLWAVEMATYVPGVPGNSHAKRHGGTGVYTDLYRSSPDGRNWTQLTTLSSLVNTPYFPNTPAGVLVPHWVDNNTVIYTEMIGYSQMHPLTMRRIVVADVAMRNRQLGLTTTRRFTPCWSQGARFYETWDVKNDMVLLCSDFGRSSQMTPGVFLWQIGSDELMPLSTSAPNEWEEQAFFVGERVFYMSTFGQRVQYDPRRFWETLQTDLWVMDMDGTHRERVTFLNEPGHAHYIDRQPGETVRCLPVSKSKHGLYLDIVRNLGSVQAHEAAQMWHLCI